MTSASVVSSSNEFFVIEVWIIWLFAALSYKEEKVTIVRYKQ
jgi:hypothetical protein